MSRISQLGYLGFQVQKLDAWEKFSTEVLGLTISARRGDGGFALRNDSHLHRFFVEPGPADDLSVVGWECPDATALELTADSLRTAGVEVVAGTDEERAARGVERLYKYKDPAGHPSEIYCGPRLCSVADRFISPLVPSGFVADELGLGHVVLACQSRRDSERFYREVLGFRLSDRVIADVHGFQADIAFLHCNPRHHSLALGERSKKRVFHFMVETRAVDDVGYAFDRALKMGLQVMHTIGRHPNDRMLSFYARTPSGFQFEFGCQGLNISDESAWEREQQHKVYDRISEWGHTPPVFLAPQPKTDKAAAK